MIKTILKIEGMMCAHCEAHMNEAIKENFDVSKVVSSSKDGETVIESKEELDADKVKEVVAEAGYTFVDMAVEQLEDKVSFFQKIKNKLS